MGDFEKYIRKDDTLQSITTDISKCQIETLKSDLVSKVQILHFELHFEINQLN